jgi:hypothetical protein
VQCVRTWGKACFVGEGDTVTLDVSADMLRRQVTVVPKTQIMEASVGKLW